MIATWTPSGCLSINLGKASILFDLVREESVRRDVLLKSRIIKCITNASLVVIFSLIGCLERDVILNFLNGKAKLSLLVSNFLVASSGSTQSFSSFTTLR